jgi:hypothetical protein
MGRKQKLNQEGIFGIREIYHTAHQPIFSRRLSGLPTVTMAILGRVQADCVLFSRYRRSPRSQRECPRDMDNTRVRDLLAKRPSVSTYINNARILVWGYNASFSSLTDHIPSKNRIHHHARTLVANLAADRQVSISFYIFPYKLQTPLTSQIEPSALGHRRQAHHLPLPLSRRHRRETGKTTTPSWPLPNNDTYL